MSSKIAESPLERMERNLQKIELLQEEKLPVYQNELFSCLLQFLFPCQPD